MGPTSTVHLTGAITADRLERIDAILARIAGAIERTRKGRVWRARVLGRPIDINVQEDPESDVEPVQIVLAAGCNTSVDYDVIRAAAVELAGELGGRWTEPTK
jgi:hypothetical protein